MKCRLPQIPNWLELADQANWSAAVLAKKCGVSVRTLERYFLKELAKCPKEWLFEQRQSRAIELLREGCAVKEVASCLGYKHASHFSRDFKIQWGHPPTQSATIQCPGQIPQFLPWSHRPA